MLIIWGISIFTCQTSDYLYRADLSGSRWSAVGIQAVLNLRAVMKNGDWDDYWNYYMAAERNRFYGNLSSQDSTNRSAAA